MKQYYVDEGKKYRLSISVLYLRDRDGFSVDRVKDFTCPYIWPHVRHITAYYRFYSEQISDSEMQGKT